MGAVPPPPSLTPQGAPQDVPQDVPRVADRRESARRGRVRRLIDWAKRRTLVRAVQHYVQRRGPILADGVTYRALFSLFAALLLFFTAAAVWLGLNPNELGAVREALDRFIPGLADLVDVDDAVAPVSFSIVGAVSLVALIAAALGAIGSLRASIRGLSRQPDDDESFGRVLVRQIGSGVLFGALLLVAAALSLLSSSGLEAVAGWIGLPDRTPLVVAVARILGAFLALVVNAAAVALAIRVLAGLRLTAGALWAGAVFGGVGLLVLQEFSGLFVRGASANPLLASFAALIALLLWINLSAQVILLAASLAITLSARQRLRRAGREWDASPAWESDPHRDDGAPQPSPAIPGSTPRNGPRSQSAPQ